MTSSTQQKSTFTGTAREIHDIRFDEVFKIITNNTFDDANELQQALFPRLITKDTGLLIPTGPGAGRLEAVVIPSLAGMRVDATAHRLFIVGPDGRPLDDYAYRLSRYVNALVKADGVERTIWFEEPDRPPISRTFTSNGVILNGAADHPFAETVDIVAMPFSHFRATFFGSGGVHGMPEAIGYDQAASQLAAPRGLIYFDDSFGATQDERSAFVRLVEFLFAQDLDIVVGSSCLPLSMRDDLAALELVDIKSAQTQPDREIEFTQAEGLISSKIVEIARKFYDKKLRIIVAFNSASDTQLESVFQLLRSELSNNALYYCSNSSRAERRQVYAQLHDLDANGKGYLAIMDGAALEASDLDAQILITEECDPVSLVRRAGRCNRRGRHPGTIISVVGASRELPKSPVGPDERRQAAMGKELRSLKSRVDYDPLIWEAFVD